MIPIRFDAQVGSCRQALVMLRGDIISSPLIVSLVRAIAILQYTYACAFYYFVPVQN